MTTVPTVTLNNGVEMPQLGAGVWRVDDADTSEAVSAALECGYRSIDTAAMYANEAGVGRAIAASGIPREELFVTTKLNNPDQGYDSALRAFDESLKQLGLDYIDLYLIHWPQSARNRYSESWQALERIYADQRVRAIGVCNFHPAHLDRLTIENDLVPAVNQIELHPYLNQADLRAYNASCGARTEAWSPLGQGGELLQDPELTAIAETHNKTVAQVILRWHLQLGNIVIPKSVTPARLRENFDVFDFTLSDAEMTTVNGLDRGLRLGPDPDEFDGS